MTQKKYDTSIVNVTNCLKWGLPNLCSCCGDIQIFSGLETERTADPTPCRRKSSASSGTTLSGTSARHFGTFAKRRSSSTSRWPVRMSSCLPTGSSWAPAHPSSRRCCAATRISTHSSTWKASHLEICRCVQVGSVASVWPLSGIRAFLSAAGVLTHSVVFFFTF